MSLKPYPKYKDSGVAWLGQVPDDWCFKPLWTLFRRIKRTGYADEQLLSVYRDYGVIIKASRDDNFNNASEDLSEYQLVEQGDMAINKMKAWQGSVGISEHRGIVSPAYFVYHSLHHEVPRYLHYLLRSPEYTVGYLSHSKGIRVNQWDLDPQGHSRMPVLLPSIAEQHSISAFLDRETAKIDSLIAEQEKLISLLAEKRQATISHAVTKGLNPNVKMKDSWVEWLGEVPEHWEMTKLKDMAEILVGYPFDSSSFCADGLPVIRMSDFGGGRVQKDDVKYVPAEDAPVSSLGRAGDILLGLSGSIGNFGVLTEEDLPVAINQRVAIVRAVGQYHKLLPWLLRSAEFRIQIECQLNATTILNISMGELKNSTFAAPRATEEILSIVDFLECETAKIDSLAAEASRAIALLGERRTALISAAVTGKIDVRDTADTEMVAA